MSERGERVLDATVTFEDYPLRVPVSSRGEVLDDVTVARCAVTIEDAQGRTATGHGRVMLAAHWAWPSERLGVAQRVDAMQQICLEIADRLPVSCHEPRHPLEHAMDAREWTDELTLPVGKRLFITERIPTLAAHVCLAPFDQALHDAYGRLHGGSSYEALGREFLERDLSAWLSEVGQGRFLDEVIYRRDGEALDAWLTVSEGDALREADAPAVEDGLPGSVEGWIARCGYRRLKLVVSGADPGADAAWVADVHREVAAIRRELGLMGAARYAVDMGEGCEGPWVVAQFLDALEAADPVAYAALDYLEQPTERDLAANRWDMRPISARKPVFVGSGVAELSDLSLAAELGWSGPALRTATGHSFVLLAMSWCELTGHPYVLGDLMNPGIGAVQAAGLAAHGSPANGIELNSMQFIPAASRVEAARFPGLFEVRDGVHHLEDLQAGRCRR